MTVLDAPSDLGLRALAPGLVPGCYKLAGALRDQGLLHRLRAKDAGVVVPPRYDIRDWLPGDGVLNAEALAAYTRRLAADAPDPGGLDYPQLVDLLRPLLADPSCVGLQVTFYDPDLDPDGRHAAALADALVMAVRGRNAPERPGRAAE